MFHYGLDLAYVVINGVQVRARVKNYEVKNLDTHKNPANS